MSRESSLVPRLLGEGGGGGGEGGGERTGLEHFECNVLTLSVKYVILINFANTWQMYVYNRKLGGLRNDAMSNVHCK